MPNSLQTLDTSFPKIDNHQTTEENFLQVTNYLYMLLENLRYTLGNLGVENINDTELDDIAKMIREPVWARIEDQEGNINTLNVTAENLLSQIGDINGNVSTLQQTSQTLTSKIQTAEGRISELTQTANGLTSKVSELETGISTQIQQTLNGITLSATNGTGNTSTITLSGGGITAKSATIQFEGFVTFGDLTNPNSNTSINGGLIKTGAINANLITTGAIKAISLYGNRFYNTGGTTWMEVGKDFSGADNDAYALYVTNSLYSSTNTGVFSVFNGDSGNVSLAAKGFTFITVNSDNDTIKVYAGSGGEYWEFTSGGIYFKNADGTQTNQVVLEN